MPLNNLPRVPFQEFGEIALKTVVKIWGINRNKIQLNNLKIIMGGIIGFILGAVYVAGIWRFLSGYRQTNFSPSLSSRIYLSLLWPVLLIANGNYRKNFQKALKGS